MENYQAKSTNKLLQVIVALLLRQRNQEPITLREQIGILSDLGLKTKEIAEILGRSNIYVNKEIFELRKAKNRKR